MYRIGLQNGVLLRTVLDQVTGDLSDTRTRYIGSRPVKLFRVTMQGSEAVLAMSSRTWITYYYQNRFHLTPLSYESLEYAAGFSSEQCPEGIVAISTNTLRILALEKLGAVFNQVINFAFKEQKIGFKVKFYVKLRCELMCCFRLIIIGRVSFIVHSKKVCYKCRIWPPYTS